MVARKHSPNLFPFFDLVPNKRLLDLTQRNAQVSFLRVAGGEASDALCLQHALLCLRRTWLLVGSFMNVHHDTFNFLFEASQ